MPYQQAESMIVFGGWIGHEKTPRFVVHFHRRRRREVDHRQFTGSDRSITLIAASLFSPCATAAPIDGNRPRDSAIVSPA